MMAISAVDMALHDLAARMHGISVAALLADRFAAKRLPMRVDHSCGRRPTRTERISARSTNILPSTSRPSSRGAASSRAPTARWRTHCAGRLGPTSPSWSTSIRAIRPRRRSGRQSSWKMPTCSGSRSRCSRRTSRATRRLRALFPLQLQAAKRLEACAPFAISLTAGAFAILQPDLSICGGYSGFRQIWALAQAYDLPVMPHVFGTAVNFHASLQMSAVLEPRRGGGPPRILRSWSTT